MVKDLLYEQKVPTSKRKYVGVEIEFLMLEKNLEKFTESIIEHNLQWNVNLGNDNSVTDTKFIPKFSIRKNAYGFKEEYIINRAERFTGKEIRILAEEDEAFNIIQHVCELIHKHKGIVNETCGLHVHLDVRNRNWELVYNNLFRYQTLMFNMQPNERRTNRYCQKLIRVLKSPDVHRHYAINKQSYDKHRTIEVRMHEGCIDGNDICGWVYFLIQVANIQTKLMKEVETLNTLNLPTDIKSYLNGRIARYA